MRGKCPCMDCEKRYPGCHDHCNDYSKWRAERKLINDERKKESEIYRDKKASIYRATRGYNHRRKDK